MVAALSQCSAVVRCNSSNGRCYSRNATLQQCYGINGTFALYLYLFHADSSRNGALARECSSTTAVP
eukprot:1218084-Pyramimonas_sp.AAC.1